MQKNVAYTTKQGSRDIWLAQTDFAVLGKEVQFTSESLYDETEKLSPLTFWFT